MIRTSLVAALLFLPASAASAQQWAAKMFETTSHDFGTVPRGGKSDFVFEFTNLYRDDVTITGVRASCGCVTPKVLTPVVKSREKGQVLATFNTRAFLGQRNATITVSLSSPKYAEIRLQIQGFVRQDVVLDPPLADFGTVDAGMAAEKRVKLNYAGRSDWQIVDVRSPNPHLSVDAKRIGRTGNVTNYELTLRLAEDAPAGSLDGQLVLVTNDQRQPHVQVTVGGAVRSALSISPPTLYLGTLAPGEKVEKRLVIRGKQPFRITAIDCDKNCFEFELPEEAKPLHVVTLTFTAPDGPKQMRETIEIQTDLAGDATQSVAAIATITVPAAKESVADSSR